MGRNIMVTALIAIVLVMFLGGCSPQPEKTPEVRVVEISVPILEIRPIPAGLIREPILVTQIPVFTTPKNPAASSCLTAEGEALLRMIAVDREARLEAWEKWATLP